MTATTIPASIRPIHIGTVYPVARTLGWGEPVEESSFVGWEGGNYGKTVFVKDGVRVHFGSLEGIVDNVTVSRGQDFIATAQDDCAAIGLRALAGVDVISVF